MIDRWCLMNTAIQLMIIMAIWFAAVWSLSCLWSVHYMESIDSNCTIIYGTPSDTEYHANCNDRHLTTIPGGVLTYNLTTLDLSNNDITSLLSYAFNGAPNLQLLNLSMAGISRIQNDSFRGLSKLTVLDLRLNPAFFNRPLPMDLFMGCSNLRSLNVIGDCFDMAPLSVMTRLEELIVVPCSNTTMLSNTLTTLRVLNFAFCKIGARLTKDFVQTFVALNIEEMSFHRCSLRYVENRTFDNFVTLRLLNFAGNGRLSVDTVINAISTSVNLTVEKLILDYVGYEIGGRELQGQRGRVLLGEHEYPVCRSAWTNLKHLSMRATNFAGITNRFVNCVPNIETAAVGYNSPMECTSFGLENWNVVQCVLAIIRITRTLRSIDMSHMSRYGYIELKRHMGYSFLQKWLPDNNDYFVPIINMSTPISQHTTKNNNEQCYHLNGFRNLNFIDMSYVYVLSALRYNAEAWDHHFKCVMVKYSSLRLANLSNIISGPNRWIYPALIGLDLLEMFDLSNSHFVEINLDNFRYFPMLRMLRLGGNALGTDEFRIFPVMPKLEELDLSGNVLNNLGLDTFTKLPLLRELDLSDNLLKAIDFIGRELSTLTIMDLSGNHLSDMSQNMMDRLNILFQEKQTFVLDISDNPLQCECDEVDFIAWIQATNINIEDRDQLTCLEGLDSVLVRDIHVEEKRINCGLTVNVLAISCATIFVAVVIATASILIYKYRWSIKWRYFKMKYTRMKNREVILLHDQCEDWKYSTYVIFPLDDDVIRSWVYGTLRPKVELEWQRPAMHLDGRDDIAGNTYVDNIVRGISESQTAIWVVCPGFLDDKHCLTASNFAFEHLGAVNNILLVLETEFRNYSVPRDFRNLLNPKLGIRRLRFTADEDGQDLFWGELSRFLPGWTHC